jgi:ADP-ribosylglycohydrolase
MKISPLGALAILGISDDLAKCAKEICELTNPNSMCIDMSVAYVTAIDTALRTGNPEKSYETAKSFTKLKITWKILEDAKSFPSPTALNTTTGQKYVQPDGQFQGYVGIAFQNAFYQLLNVTPEKGGFYKVIIDTVSLGGDTDTNACIAGALYGACYGYSDIPKEWTNKIKCFKNSTKRNYPPLDHNHLFEMLKLQNK